MKGLYTVVLNSKLIVDSVFAWGLCQNFFVIGHELFHALEHDCDEIRFFREHTGFKTSIYEEEANFFSVQLLKDYIEYHQDEVADLEIAEEIEKFIWIKKAVAYNNLNSKVKNKRVTNGN